MAIPAATPAIPETADAAATALITVEVAYERLEQQCLLSVTVPAVSTVADVLKQARLEQRFADLDWQRQPVGIWSRVVALDHPVQAGDRVEVYRPLQLDPATTLRQKDRTRRKERGLPPRTK